MRHSPLAFALLLAISAGCSSSEETQPTPAPGEYRIGGTISGLEGALFTLQLAMPGNLFKTLAVEADGPFTFGPLKDGTSYEVTVLAQPVQPIQVCTVTNGSGVVSGADVADIQITCDDAPPDALPTHSIGGTVMGLKGAGLVLHNSSEEDLPIAMNGPFTFATPVQEYVTYEVTVAAQPTDPAQHCFVTNGKAVLGQEDVTDIVVTCSVDPATVDVKNADRCDFLDPAHCHFPFPSDHFTVLDPSTATGRRVALHPASMPVNKSVDLSPAIGAPPGTLVTPGDVPIDPTEWNRNDGFSPGQMALTYVPGLDLAATGIGPITHMERSLDPDSPLVVIDADSGERHLVWGELDAYATTDATRALILHAGVNYREGHRYIVALRDLKDKDGNLLEPSPAFQVYRDAVPSAVPAIEARRERMEQILGTLSAAGIARESLYIAWDFTVASRRNLSERVLHIRDDAFAALGDEAPSFTVTKVTQNPDANRSRRIEGTFTVPSYLDKPGGASGAAFYYAQPDDGLPDRMNADATQQANFICNIPRAALADGEDATSPVTPGRAALYGHGQQGSAGQVNGGAATGELSNLYNFVFCATDFIGMASDDDLNILTLVTDYSRMNTVADRVQQGLLNNLYLARLMIHPKGFVADANFRGGPQDEPLIETSDVFYYGISQGGILGGSLIAVAQDIRRGVLGVPGMNYSLLLDRAVGFDDLRPPMDAAYPGELDRRFIFSAIQMLWDRGETNGYAWHMTGDPLPNTPPHDVLLHVAFGDHQVTHWSADIEARTIGAGIHFPAIAPGRSEDMTPHFGIPAIPSYPFYGSAMFVWDTGPFDMALNKGTPAPPVENQPPRLGVDPHGAPRVQPGARLQIAEFLRSTGKVINPCGDAPCSAP